VKRILLLVLMLSLLSALVPAQSQPAQAAQPAAKPAGTQAPQAAQAAQPAQPAAPPTVTQVLDRALSNLERNFVSAAEAMPEDKFEFRPPADGGAFSDVRTFRQQVLHVAANNFLFASMLTGEPPKVTPDDRANGPAAIKTKAEAVQYLKDSFAAAHKGIATVNDQNQTEMVKFPFGEARMARLALANIFAWHGYDHYGQMVVYLRMNSIVPPGSQPRG
jgi:uncharacterized damage-inducible protein DinB